MQQAMGTIAGTWSGISSTSQVGTTLRLTESNGAISGKMNWPGDSRKISGKRYGESVVFNVEGGDQWTMTFFNGNTLQGRAIKPNGNTYALSFTRTSH